MSNTTIRQLNDEFRKSFRGGHILATPTVQALDAGSRSKLFNLVQVDVPTPGNDPYGEADFGCIEHESERFFWKIDYYDSQLSYASPDPSNPAVTTRVLTIMHSSEY